MTREEQIRLLIDSLREMVSLLERDSSCGWVRHFKMSLDEAIDLSINGWNERDLAALSSSIRSVYAGMGSFNDYFPARYDPATGRYASFPWADQFDRLRASTFNQAVALVVRTK
ncbi:DUF6966 domain-containing protein [Dyella sp. 2RAF44]|uniref:DUF6966 domain-containing protein n=1 Tax=Dyella sp. 2RAF44 TaxID=3233000 RepID=UPI003F929FF4